MPVSNSSLLSHRPSGAAHDRRGDMAVAFERASREFAQHLAAYLNQVLTTHLKLAGVEAAAWAMLWEEVNSSRDRHGSIGLAYNFEDKTPRRLWHKKPSVLLEVVGRDLTENANVYDNGFNSVRTTLHFNGSLIEQIISLSDMNRELPVENMLTAMKAKIEQARFGGSGVSGEQLPFPRSAPRLPFRSPVPRTLTAS